ncbi:histidine kinase dimerization/phosphoacceptor domain -containing protein [Methylopila henanensis]|uniref:histidine kinase n=1 Tax=Methylopila henanensis TaxID=873516 RepID=A0ABW4K9U9_9HYPH
MLKTLRANIALLLIAANLPVIALAVWIGVRDFRAADLSDRDRLVQAAELVAARATAFPVEREPLSQQARRVIFQDRGSRAMISVAILDGEGRVIAEDAQSPLGGRWLPAGALPDKRLPSDERILKGRGADGRAYRYAIAPIEGAAARVVAATPFDFMGRSQTQWLLLALGLPALMSLLCVGLVLFGIERFVLRWIRALRVTAEAYQGGRLDVKATKLDGAPAELARLGDALDAMSARVDERSNALQAAVADRDTLLRELHHRVKNNFQMIASLLALQRQEAPQSLSAVLRAPEDRVRAMAAAYKASYASGEIGHVDVATLVRDVALQARDVGTERSFDVSVAVANDIGEIDLDRAVSVALLSMELLTAAGAAGSTASVSVSPCEDGRMMLRIAADAPGWLPATGLPMRLIRAYADQLSSAIEDDGAGVVAFAFAPASDKPSIGMKPRQATG